MVMRHASTHKAYIVQWQEARRFCPTLCYYILRDFMSVDLIKDNEPDPIVSGNKVFRVYPCGIAAPSR